MTITKEALAATLDSYEAAMARAFELFPRMERRDGGSGFHLYVPTSLRGFDGDLRAQMALADEIRASHDYGLKRDMDERTWVWRSSFFKAGALIRVPFTMYEWQGELHWVSEDGTESGSEPAGLRERTSHLYIHFNERSWGLGDWRKRADEIRAYADAAPDGLRQAYTQQVNDAERTVQRWMEKRRELAALELPV